MDEMKPGTRWEARPMNHKVEWEVVQPDPTAIDGCWYVAEVFDCVEGLGAEKIARLIAAAPVLVEVLESVAAMLPTKVCERHGVTAALALARGQS